MTSPELGLGHLVGISDRLVPRHGIDCYRHTDPKRYKRERYRERSLLFVAATRARDELVITWHGNSSPFLVAPSRRDADTT
jgi:superfamily I DNA/RNA helicase